jgi:endonuclease YncB( thermonuclease family)
MTLIFIKKALILSAFFVLGLSPLAHAENVSCPTLAPSQSVDVAQVFDGDTVQLRDKRRVRLIGINALELKENSKEARELAEQSKDALKRWVDARSARLYLTLDREGFDHYGRVLGYLHDAQGDDAGEYLISQGLVYAVAIAPNVSRAKCYFSAEERARSRRLGVWGQLPIVELDKKSSLNAGFVILTGRVTQKLQFKKSFAIILDGRLVVLVKAKAFDRYAAGAQMTVRGWVQKKRFVYKKQYYPYQMVINDLHNIQLN